MMKVRNLVKHFVIVSILCLFVVSSFYALELGTVPATSNKPSIDSAANTKSEIDFGRVDWRTNHFPNDGFELWNDIYSPANLNPFTTVDRWTEIDDTFSYEGSKSLYAEVRSQTSKVGESRISRSGYAPMNNPANTTFSFWWYIEELQNPTDADDFYLYVEMNSKEMYYYLNCNASTLINGTNRAYFFLEDSLQTWNQLSRNLTSDYYEAFDHYPTVFDTFEFWIHSRSNEYVRIYIDDIYLINGTEVMLGGSTLNGNFEGSGTWTWYSSRSAAIVTQGADSYEGDWCFKGITRSNGNESRADFSEYPYVRLTASNPGALVFRFKIDNWTVATDDTYAYVYLSGGNRTRDMSLYIPLCYGSSTVPFGSPEYFYYYPTDFNVTNQWNYVGFNIMDKVNEYTTTDEFIVSDIQFYMMTREKDANLTVSLDSLVLSGSYLNAMGFEDEGDVGEVLRSFDIGEMISPEFVVTDDAYQGGKAANLTLVDNQGESFSQDFNYIPFNGESELFLDFTWRIDNFTGQEYEEIIVSVYFDTENPLAYVLANGSPVEVGESGDPFMLPTSNTQNEWIPTQRNLLEDYINFFGEVPDTSLEGIEIDVSCRDGGEIKILFDEMYIYMDDAPEFTSYLQNPAFPEAGYSVHVEVDVYDYSSLDVDVVYRVDTGPWESFALDHVVNDTYEGDIPGQAHDAVVEYYYVANDTSGKVTELHDMAYYFTYTVTDTVNPYVDFVNPEPDDTVSGEVITNVNVTDAGGVQRVEFYIDGIFVLNDTSWMYSYTWNTLLESDGQHNITAIAYDYAGNSQTITIDVTVSNPTVTSSTTTTTASTTTPTTTGAGDLITIILLIIGVVVVIVMFIVGVTIGKKKTR
ncbi:MAG: Ig-like domain-containing protein [Candidatus Thorarchaeota archaeon]